jgi:uncharacterized protein (DUF885 family)
MRKWLVLLFVVLAACNGAPKENGTATTMNGDKDFRAIRDAYVIEFLKHYPVVNTYLGGGGLDPSLVEIDGRLRDYSPAAIATEDQWLTEEQQRIEKISPDSLSPTLKIDRGVMLAQINFLLHEHQARRYQERALDSYMDEPIRAIDWQLQGMTPTSQSTSAPVSPSASGSPPASAKASTFTAGTDDEWSLVAKRLGAIPQYMVTAQNQLSAGIASNNTPDYRVLRRYGIETAEDDAKYMEKTLPQLASDRITGPQKNQLVVSINDAGAKAAAAYRGLKDFVIKSFYDDPSKKDPDGLKPEFRADRFAMGEAEYNWALKNNLHVDKTAAQLYDESWPIVQQTQQEMIDLARQIGAAHGWTLPSDGPAAVRAVLDELSKDYPKSDEEMVAWYRDAALRLVDYARKTGLFDVPADYKLDVVETPPPLRASIEGAAYYPAPPFKNNGVGRFYVTPTGNDQAALKDNNRAALADLSAHEGFPGHDWHYKVMTGYRNDISGVRWLTPGAVEDSSSMWEDSMAAEGWGLYAESLMAEPQPGYPNGFYTPEERLYQLKGKLYRDLRVRIDTGIHTGRMSYSDAVDLFSQVSDFQPGSCQGDAAGSDPAKRASCEGAERAVFRYSKWPTQAITYRLGKDQILELRNEAAKEVGPGFSPKEFHLLFMKQGTIPAGYFREELLKEISKPH